jgi:type 1 glutamine amidotransferase
MTEILLFSGAAAFVHDSIPHGVALVEEEAARAGIAVHATDDPAVFDTDLLERVAATVWMNTSGTQLSETGRARFSAYLRAGGGFAGIHCAGDSEVGWPEYGRIIGARFLHHPMGPQRATLVVTDRTHPSTDFLPERWAWDDEWYAFTDLVPEQIHTLLEVDESTYESDVRMGEHPIAWWGRYGEGRTWFTALGHFIENYADPLFRRHVWAGITSVLRPE